MERAASSSSMLRALGDGLGELVVHLARRSELRRVGSPTRSARVRLARQVQVLDREVEDRLELVQLLEQGQRDLDGAWARLPCSSRQVCSMASMCWPSSIWRARCFSSAAESRKTLPISRRYMRTGSSMPSWSSSGDAGCAASRSSSASCDELDVGLGPDVGAEVTRAAFDHVGDAAEGVVAAGSLVVSISDSPSATPSRDTRLVMLTTFSQCHR